MLNNVCLMGRLTADPELKHTESGTPGRSFTHDKQRNYTPTQHKRQPDLIQIATIKKTA